MKILLLLLLLVFGCEKKNELDEIENYLFELNEIYVVINQNEVHEIFGIDENDYHDSIALRSLVEYQQKEIYIFYEVSDSLKNKLHSLEKEDCFIFELNSYIYFGINDLDVIHDIKEILNNS